MDLYATDNSYPAYSILIRDTKDIWGALKKRDSIWFLCQRSHTKLLSLNDFHISSVIFRYTDLTAFLLLPA